MYSTAAEVRQYSQIKPADLGFADVTALDSWLTERLLEVADYINGYCQQSWAGADIPPGIHAISREMCRNIVSLSVTSRETPVVRINDWTVRMVEPEILTASIRRALRLYRKKSRIRMLVLGTVATE